MTTAKPTAKPTVVRFLPWILWIVSWGNDGKTCDGYVVSPTTDRCRGVAERLEGTVRPPPTSSSSSSSSVYGRSVVYGGGRRSFGPAGICGVERALLAATPRDDDDDGDGDTTAAAPSGSADPTRPILFSILTTTSGAVLGPFLDSYHSDFGVLSYDAPFTLPLWSADPSRPALVTTPWVPPLFGLAGFLIGWLYVLLDETAGTDGERTDPSVPLVFLGIAVFTFQYYLSGLLFSNHVDRTSILLVMTLYAGVGYYALDRTAAGFITSLATAMGGPLIEIGLLSTLGGDIGGYHYTDPGETGFFPLWIAPVYFLGGPANGNLARMFWNALDGVGGGGGGGNVGERDGATAGPCGECGDSRAVPCPNCEGKGDYVTYDRVVRCNCCRGSGRVMCRACFGRYGEDPADVGAIRDFMARMPD